MPESDSRTAGFGSPNCTGMKHTASVRKSSSGSGSSAVRRGVAASRRFAVCVNNDGYEVSLECNKIYVVVPDKDAEKDDDLRIVDESGEEYLFSADRFVAIDVPPRVKKSVLQGCRAHTAPRR